MKSSLRFILGSAVLALAIPPASLLALSDTEASAGRALGKRFADAVVGVELIATIKLSIGGHAAPPREVRLDANGTVISADGLTVTSLIEIDPRRTAEAATRNLTLASGQRVQIGATEFRDVRLLLADGSEIAAKIVRTDAARDLAFLVPVADPAAAKRAYTWVKLADAAPPAILGSYFVVSRASKSLQRVPEVHASTIEGIVETPQSFFIPDGFVTGCPMLDLQGRVLGLCLTQMVDGHPMLVGGHPSGIILPAAEVAAEAVLATAPTTAKL